MSHINHLVIIPSISPSLISLINLLHNILPILLNCFKFTQPVKGTKLCQRNPSKKKQKELFSIFWKLKDSYMEPDEIILKFKHSKIESN